MPEYPTMPGTLRHGALLLALLAAGCVTAPPPETAAPRPQPAAAASGACAAPAATEAAVLAGVNRQRASAGLGPLRPNAALTGAARDHACDIARRGTLSHSGGDGSTLATRLRRHGYGFATAAENVARGPAGPAEVVALWMNSSGHRANILNGRIRDAGLGLAAAPDGRPYWVMVFAAPR